MIDGEMERDLEIGVKEERWRISNLSSRVDGGRERSTMEEDRDQQWTRKISDGGGSRSAMYKRDQRWRREIGDGGGSRLAMEGITDTVNGNWAKGRGLIRRI